MTCPEPVAITRGPNHHFFGYYDKCPWDATGRYVLAGQIGFIDRHPTPDDPLTVGMVDTADGNRFIPLAQTRAWNWQMGCALQWMPDAADRRILYNDRRDGRLCAVIRDVFDGTERVLPRPVYAVSPTGRLAVSLDFDRVHVTRLGYGYPMPSDPSPAELVPAPDDQGVYAMDLDSGDSRLILSIAQLAASEPIPEMDGAIHWVNHLQWNTTGTRFAFLSRFRNFNTSKKWDLWSRLYSADPDGGGLYLLPPLKKSSHYDWRNETEIVTFSALERGQLPFYMLLADGTRRAEPIGTDCFTDDGHCNFSPDRRWMLTDTYPRPEPYRTLILYRWPSGPRIDVGRFFSPPEVGGELRCDLHPRFSRDGTKVCIDSSHERVRQMYVLDVSGIVGR